MREARQSPGRAYRTAGEDCDFPNEAVAAQIGNAGTSCLEQAGRSIILNRGNVPKLCKLLKNL